MLHKFVVGSSAVIGVLVSATQAFAHHNMNHSQELLGTPRLEIFIGFAFVFVAAIIIRTAQIIFNKNHNQK